MAAAANRVQNGARRIVIGLCPHAVESVACKGNHGPKILSLPWCEDPRFIVLRVFDDDFVSHIRVVSEPGDASFPVRAYRNRRIIRKSTAIANALSSDVPNWLSVIRDLFFGNRRCTSCEQKDHPDNKDTKTGCKGNIVREEMHEK
jgi:hypothetical protein